MTQTMAHNTVVVNDKSMAAHCPGECVEWFSGNVADIFIGRDKGYSRFGVTHTRALIYIKSKCFVVWDWLKQDGDRANKLT